MFFLVSKSVIADSNAVIIEPIRKSTLEYIRTIHSIEYEVNEEDKLAKGKTRYLKYWQQDNMFRSESSLDGLGEWTSTFNGERHQIFFKERETMSLKNTTIIPNPFRIMGPPTIAFTWLTKSGMAFTWSDFTSETNVNTRFKEAKYIREDSVNGENCTVLEFSGIVDKSTIRVWFSRGKSNFPIKSVLNIDGRVVAETIVTSFDTILLDDGNSIVVPINVVGTNNVNQSKPSVARSTSIVPGTLKINKKYDKDFFMLPTTLAKTVNDLDKLEAAGLLGHSYDLPKARHHSYLLLVVVNVVVIAILLYRMLVLKRK
jgi:hypothetical protein